MNAFTVLPVNIQSSTALSELGDLLLTCLRFFDCPDILVSTASIFNLIFSFRKDDLYCGDQSRDCFLSTPGVLKLITGRLLSSLPGLAANGSHSDNLLKTLLFCCHFLVFNPELSVDPESKQWTFYTNQFEVEIKNEVPDFISNLFNQLEQSETISENKEVECTSGNALRATMDKISKFIRNPKSNDGLRQICIKLIGGVASNFPDALSTNLFFILEPLQMVSENYQVSDTVKDLAVEVFEIVKNSVGTDTFISVLSEVKLQRETHRSEKMNEKARLAINDPAEYAKEKRIRNERKKDSRKRRSVDERSNRSRISLRYVDEPSSKRSNI
ncbi:hypothetical protein GEMRC1_007655 [Eukaryota sp. GEM-RC1]